MANGNGNGNGAVFKSLAAAGGLILTVVVTLWASGGTWGKAQQQIVTIEEKNTLQDVRLDCHDKELTSLKLQSNTLSTNQAIILQRLDKQDAKLDLILGRLPAGGAHAMEPR